MNSGLNPIVSFITVVKNDVKGLRKTYESLASQDDFRFEWIVIDGNSVDGSKDFVSTLLPKFRTDFYQTPPRGIYNAMNFGWKFASGKFVNFLNAGDTINPNEFSKLADELLLLDNNTFLACRVAHRTPSGFLYDISIPRIQSDKYVIANHQGCFVPLSALIIQSGFDEDLKYAADGKFLDSMLKTYSMAVNERVIITFAMGGASTRNYRKTLSEIESYRKVEYSTLARWLLIIKTRIRVIVIQNEFVFRPCLSRRSKSFAHLI